jgi:hypothetical protein
MHNMNVPQKDVDILRRLAAEQAEIAALPVQAETAERWRKLNDLEDVRPMVRVYQLPWRELNVHDELTLECSDEWARDVEWVFRETLYQWRHMRWDMLVEPVFYTPKVIRNTGCGISPQTSEIPHDSEGGVRSIHYDCQIAEEADIEKIRMPELTSDPEATEAQYERARRVFDGILDVRVRGRVAHSYSPWDRLSEWCNPQQVLMDLVMRPDFIHALMERLTSAYLHELDQLEALDALSIGNGWYGIGEGGLACTKDLPLPEDVSGPARLIHQWGGAAAQIFSEVSPAMHEEFALAYEKRILDRCGLNYYGCCEPLDRKVDIIAKALPKLRKISMSPWVVPERGAEAIAGRFVYSAKPNPACLATDNRWDRRGAEAELRRILDATGGRRVELIMKDVSTVRFEPQRAWEWTELAMGLAREYE